MSQNRPAPPAQLLHPRQRAVPRWFIQLIVTALGVHNLGWFLYLLVVPADTLLRSPTWVGALEVTPTGQPAFIAGGLGLSGALILAGAAHRRLHDLALFGHVLGCGLWALLAGSFAYSASLADGLGAGNAQVFALVAVLYGAFAWLRRH